MSQLPIQIFLSLIIVFFIVRLVLRYKKANLNGSEFVTWLFFWLIALTIVLLPETVNFLARSLKVGRGVDLVIYLALMILFYIFFKLSLRLEKIEQDISQVVRKVAMEEENEVDKEEE